MLIKNRRDRINFCLERRQYLQNKINEDMQEYKTLGDEIMLLLKEEQEEREER